MHVHAYMWAHIHTMIGITQNVRRRREEWRETEIQTETETQTQIQT